VAPHPERDDDDGLVSTDPLRVLFVCSKNQWRSPTAERIFRSRPDLAVRSAGTSSSARRHLTLEDVRWADLICVMETKHLERLRADFRQDLRGKRVVVLEIPDDYRFMDPALVSLLEERVGAVLDEADDGLVGLG
jgi:predicted protein tyrosine phosphatase